MTPEGWYYKQGGTLVGPVRRDQVEQMKDSGRLGPADTVWAKWRRGGDVLYLPSCLDDIGWERSPRPR